MNYLGIFRQIRTLRNPSIFNTFVYSEPEAYSEAWYIPGFWITSRRDISRALVYSRFWITLRSSGKGENGVTAEGSEFWYTGINQFILKKMDNIHFIQADSWYTYILTHFFKALILWTFLCNKLILQYNPSRHLLAQS